MDINNEFIKLFKEADNGDKQSIRILCDYFTNDYYLVQTFDETLVDFYKNGTGPYSIFSYGYILYNNLNSHNNKDKYQIGLDLIKKSADMGCSQALLFILMIKKYGGDIDYKSMTCDDMEKELIKTENHNIYFSLAKELIDNDDNILEGIKYYKKAIKLGNSCAMVSYGIMKHDNGKYNLAKKYYNKAIKHNNNNGYFNLGVMYREGEGYKTNYKKALELFTKSMNLGNVRAMVCIGDMHYDDDDIDEAIKYFKMASKKNDPIACYKLGIIYTDMFNDVDVSDDSDQSANLLELKDKYIIKSGTYFLKGAYLGDFRCIRKLHTFGLNLDSTDEDILNIPKLFKLYSKFKYFGACDAADEYNLY